ncbi:hypothetical protein RND81_14G098700 [Saponaria officinalis]|uniref:BED-type domain-containing protein n=1 Tax=Saponaria officinalis TaxID=3572 RepID=A0AAW1GKH3_SAPOF
MDKDQSQCAQSKNFPPSFVASGHGDNSVFVDSTSIRIHDLDGEEEGFLNLKSDSYAPSTKKRTSDVWLYFDVVMTNGVRKARCKGCKKYLSYNGANGVSHVRKHASNSCPKRLLRNDSSQSKLRTKIEPNGSSTLELKEKYKEFDQEFSRSKLVTAIVLHEYPLSMVDHFGFRDFIKSLNPTFKMISRNTLRNDIFKMYKDEKLSLMRLLEHNDSRVAVTTDMWTASNQKKGYMADLRNRTLRFCFVPCPHTKGVLAKVLMDCLSQYCLEIKISSVVVDNCTTNDAMIKILLKNFEKKCLMLKGSFLHLRCSAHILNLIVKDGLDVIESGIVKKFEEACRYLGINNSKRLILDCKTRWNSTFYMLESALPYIDMFDKIKRLNRSVICERLQIFDKTTKVFSGRHYPTSNLFFRKACQIKITLRAWLTDDVYIVKYMATNMINKFDMYWEHISGILAIAAILDPRNKMDCVEYYFKRLYGDDCVIEVEKYQERNERSKDQEEDSKINGKRMHPISCEDKKKRKVNVKGEVDHYLVDDTEDDNETFDILDWWKTDRRDPTLRKIAKDILAIPISSIASESAFSMGGRVSIKCESVDKMQRVV